MKRVITIILQILLFVLFIACNNKGQNCIVDIEVHRPNTPSPDNVKYILSIADGDLKNIIENGDFKGIYFPQISEERNFNFKFPERMDVEGDNYIFLLETTRFRLSEEDFDSQVIKFKNEAKIIIDREEENIVFTVCE